MEEIGESSSPPQQTPLLSQTQTPQSPENFAYSEDQQHEQQRGFWDCSGFSSSCLWEMNRQLGLAGPLVAVNLLQYSLQILSLMFVGHLGELQLSGASLATSFANVSGFSVLLGLGTALDTFCGQSYGAKQFQMLGLHMQQAMLVLFFVSVPIMVVWSFTSQILIFFGQNVEISNEAEIYIKWLIPSLFSYGFLQCHVRFLQSQNIVVPMLISSGITTFVHVPVCWLLVFKSRLGSKGAAMATSMSYWINVILLALYIKFSSICKQTWTGLSKDAVHGILNFLRLAIPSACMVCLEYWSFEMVVLLAGFLHNPKLETSVLSISLNTMWMVYMIPTGLGSAASVRVSNELGAGNAEAARVAVCTVIIISATEGLLVALATVLVRHQWGYLYSNEIEVVTYVSKMMPLLAVSDFMDGMQCALSGAARGCGWQKTCSIINLGAYYLVGVPSAILFAFILHIGGMGLWMGIICALIVQLLVLLVIILSTDWYQEAIKAKSRVYSSVIKKDAMSSC